ncbi:hypothetical protein H8959_004100 [Pygathrix nigripes]
MQNLDVSENMMCSQNKPFRVAGVEKVKDAVFGRLRAQVRIACGEPPAHMKGSQSVPAPAPSPADTLCSQRGAPEPHKGNGKRGTESKRKVHLQ